MTDKRLQFLKSRKNFDNGWGRCVGCNKWLKPGDPETDDEIEVGGNGYKFHKWRFCSSGKVGKAFTNRIRFRTRGRGRRNKVRTDLVRY